MRTPAVWGRVRADRILLTAVVAGAVVFWVSLALVDVRILVLLPLIAGAAYAAMRVRGPVEQKPPDDPDDWY